MCICYAVRSSSEAALHDVGVVADDPPVVSFPPNKIKRLKPPKIRGFQPLRNYSSSMVPDV